MDDIDKKYEADFDLLLTAAIEIGNKLSGKQYSSDSNNLIYAEGLGQKIISHILSVRRLKDGYSPVAGGNLYQPTIDFASIFILTRAAIETYLTLNFIFTFPKEPDVKEFRFMCWDLAGYLERAGSSPMNDENIKLKESEKLAIELLRNKIKINPYFLTLPPQLQGLALNGQWRLNYSWSKIAKDAGIGGTVFDQQYKFLCGYAHSSRLSTMQIQQTKGIENQLMMARSSLAILMFVLAKHMFDYINIIPELKSSVDLNSFQYKLIFLWKEIGENMETFFIDKNLSNPVTNKNQ